MRAIWNKSWQQHPTKQQLYDPLPPITKTIKVWQTRHVGHCRRSKDKLISGALLWTPSHGRAKAGRPARTYRQQFCADTGCYPEDQPEAMDDRDGWQERVRDIRADGVTWWRILNLTLTVWVTAVVLCQSNPNLINIDKPTTNIWEILVTFLPNIKSHSISPIINNHKYSITDI